MALLGDPLDLLVKGPDADLELRQDLEHGADDAPQGPRDVRAGSLAEGLRGAAGDAPAERLDLPTREGDELGAQADQLVPCVEQRSSRTAGFAAQFDRAQEPRIDAAQPGQDAGIVAVVLARALRDQM